MNEKSAPEKAQPKPARLVVVEDHVVVRDGLVALINRNPGLKVVATAETTSEALTVIAQHRPQLVIADMVLREGNCLDLIKQAVALYPECLFLVISMQDEEVFAERCIRAGAKGYIMKHAATDEFMDAIQCVLQGEVYISRKMNVRLLHRMTTHSVTAGSGLESLTDRELQIYQMIGAGMTTREIAPQLGISPKTVATHRENLKLKLGLTDGRALLQSAMHWLEKSNK